MAAAGARLPLALLLPLFVTFFASPASATDTITANSSLSDGQTLVSAGGVFQLGFFTPASSTARFLGIWYMGLAPQTVVWVANREAPITGTTASLAINATGSLVLADPSGRVFWSSPQSNMSSTGSPVGAQLLDSGNFVLQGGGGAVLWQSFDYPSDTLLPGMKLGWDLTTGLDRHLTTWRSTGDPSPGDYTFGFDLRGVPEGFIRRDGTVPVYRNGPWNGLQFSGEPEMEPNNSNFQFEFVDNASDVYYTFLVDGGGGSGNGGVVSRFVLNQSSVQRYVWPPGGQGWSLYWSLPRDQCDNYAHCGAFGACDTSGGSAACACVHGFTPASPRDWELRDSSAGCRRLTRLNCTGDGFLPLRGVKLPDTTNATEDATITVDQCRQRCLANCSCLAYAASSIKGGDSGCIIWSSPLIDIRHFPSGGQDLFVRLAASDLLAAEAAAGVQDPYIQYAKNQCAPDQPNVSTMTWTASDGDGSRKKNVVVAVVVSLSAVLLVGVGGFFLWKKLFRNKAGRFQSAQRFSSFDSSVPLTPVQLQDRSKEDEAGQSSDLNVTLFDMDAIALSTDNFAAWNKLGEGGFGAVYKGQLEGGQAVAVKRLSKYSTQGLGEFKNEVMLIAKLQHVNLVRLLGCCVHGEERMLVYEYMENKSLDNFIFGNKNRSAQLHWSKSGYMSPEYAMDGVFSVKSDVFSFGVLVLEIVSGRKNRGMYSSGEQTSLLSQAWRLWREGNALALLDEAVVRAGTHRSSEVLRCVQVALLCVQERPDDRPHMAAVFLALGNPSAVLPQPRHPGYCTDRGSASTDGEWSSTCTVNDVTVTIVEGR
ncbi:G-type lectin S-receptor-like serine/threonine-protein kinase B120 [Zea mays]|uniref:Receptor-like serine/threonine-protein kinase n=1 Tax=Zea mays TaxID=4577 RepID=A0A1D6IEI1_MAIZE|nr:G-type lectin S-receptor-like serine/threonine-protein kinase B120 [Zea mays]